MLAAGYQEKARELIGDRVFQAHQVYGTLLAARYKEKACELIGPIVFRAERVEGRSSWYGLGNVAGSRV